MALRRTQLLALLLAATVLLSLAVPALQQEAGSKSSKAAAQEAAIEAADEAAAEEEAASEEPATEAPFAKGAKSETADDEDGPPVEAADADAPAKTPSKTTQPAAPAPKAAAAPAPKGGAAKATGPPKPAKKSKIVEIAPEAEVQNEVDDIDVTGGKCADFLKSSSCAGVEPGEAAVAQCISDLVAAAEAGDSGQDSETVPEECASEVYEFMIVRGKNINANLPLARACKSDAERLCNNTWLVGAALDGSIISCLRDQKEQLSRECAKEVFLVQLAIAQDYRADPAMAAACKEDVAKYCADVKEGGGRKAACLVKHKDKLNPECGQEVFRQQLEADDDIRLNRPLFQKCLADKKQYCGDVAPGHAAVRDCLVEHRGEPGFSQPCREELEAMIEARVRDFRIDSRLQKLCGKYLMELCGSMDSYDVDETDLNNCLQDSIFLQYLPDGSCKTMIYEYQKLAAQDVRFDVPLADACMDDRVKLCGNVQPGSARVIRCLQRNRDKLNGICRAVLFDEEVRFSENIDFQYPMKQACAKEMERFCKDVPHGNARVIRCLQHNKDAKEFSKACRQEVASYESAASQDYQLNFRLKKECKGDIAALCKDACHPGKTSEVRDSKVCGGTVLRCLTEKRDDIKSEACRKEVFYFEKMEVSNFHNDVILAAQCRGDVDKFCKDVPPGEGRVHACLRQHRKEISPGCRAEEMLLEQQEAEHIELRPNLLKACADERQSFCKSVSPGSGRVFRCLAEKLADPDFGQACRMEVIVKLQRRQANWRLDPALRRACKADVAELCKLEDGRGSETGEVYRCLIHNHDDLDPGCRKELGRAVHMAFFIWSAGATLTAPCDDDVAALCLKARPNMDAVPGAVGSCLADILERQQAAEATARKVVKEPAGSPAAPPQLTDECRVLADVAEPPNMKRAFDTTLSVALLESQLSALESKTGVAMVKRDQAGHAQALTLTGWTAIAGVAAMVVLVLVGGTYAYKRYTGVPLDSTTVVLKRPRYNRVAGVES